MGTGAGKSLGRAERGAEGGGASETDTSAEEVGGAGEMGWGVISLGGVLQQSPPLTPGRAVKGRA